MALDWQYKQGDLGNNESENVVIVTHQTGGGGENNRGRGVSRGLG